MSDGLKVWLSHGDNLSLLITSPLLSPIFSKPEVTSEVSGIISCVYFYLKGLFIIFCPHYVPVIREIVWQQTLSLRLCLCWVI